MDDELRRLERAAATDPEARERLALSRRRVAPEPPADITLHQPFPIRLPYPVGGSGRCVVPIGVEVQGETTVLAFDQAGRGRTTIDLVHLRGVRTVEDVEWEERERLAELRVVGRGQRVRGRPCGAGQVVHLGSPGIGGALTTYLLSAEGVHGAVRLRTSSSLRFAGAFEVGWQGAWEGAPLLAGAPPWEVGRSAWTLVVPRRDTATLVALRDSFKLTLPEVQAFKARKDGALFVGLRADLDKARELLVGRTVEAFLLWTESLTEVLPTLPERA